MLLSYFFPLVPVTPRPWPFVALEIPCWIIKKIFYAICSLLEKIGVVAGTIRKNMAKKKFLERLKKAAQEATADTHAFKEIKEVIESFERNEADAFLAPVNEEGEEDYTEIRIIRVKDSTQDDTPDFCYVHAHKRIIKEMTL